jgi:dTDP-4-amino-4,6-dideoxygalactose transaminase
MHSYYANRYSWKPEDFPVAFGNFNRMVSLPLSAKMSDQDVADVIEAVTDVVAVSRRRAMVA